MQIQNNFMLFTSWQEMKAWLYAQVVTRKILLIQNHHTAVPNYSHFDGSNHFARLEGMRSFHVHTRGFSATAQHFTTFPDGSIGVSLDRTMDDIPAGIKGANAYGICIEHLGNFDIGADQMTAAQKQAVIALNRMLCEKFNLPIDTEHVVYHHWWSAQGSAVYDLKTGSKLAGTSAKSCPGTGFFGGNTVVAAQNNFIPLIKRMTTEEQREEDQPMTNEERLQFEALVKRVTKLESERSMPVPVWAKAAVEAAVQAKLIDTPDGGSKDFYRLLALMHRRGLLTKTK
ncbi:N-acetylmuramoyl-L-alanine amidase [Paenibacillus sp. GCM10023252]|uniref:peptidoglycan recognition protein family protein n=1 Tax=Paenibacillus sp. GCM10023252 TaxID=3252649 RepID=UPI003623875F